LSVRTSALVLLFIDLLEPFEKVGVTSCLSCFYVFLLLLVCVYIGLPFKDSVILEIEVRSNRRWDEEANSHV
jgi:hypothetical protein